AISRSRKWRESMRLLPLTGYLQWGRDLSIAEIGLHVADKVQKLQIFNGAAISRSPKWRKASMGKLTALSSMGPRSLDRGNDGTPTPGAIRAQSSMGPRSLDRGNHGAVVCSKTTIRASMGPRSLDRGNLPAENKKARRSFLQLGRDLSIAEMKPSRRLPKKC